MTDTKHTPGPWSVHFENKWPWSISISPNVINMTRIAYSTANKSLEDVRNATAFDYDERDSVAKMVAEQEANARLIDAAPDLLEAASALIDDVKRRYPNEELRCEFMLALDAAIAKATQ